MSIADRALEALRRVFGDERDERERAESPSADALTHAPSSTYAIWGREDIGGLLSVSQNLMDRYADYEAMNDYPDIRCFTGDMKVYVVGDNNVITPMTIKDLAASRETYRILSYDAQMKTLVSVIAEHPRISGRNAPILRLELSNGESLRVTPTHKILCVEPRPGFIEAKELRKGAFIIGTRGGFELNSKSVLTVKNAGGVWLKADPIPEGYAPTVYDITTVSHNLLVNGVICHNSAFHYFANDATQPNMDNGRVCWVQSPDQAVVDMADTLIKRRLRLEDDLFSIAYTLCQYGNCLPASARVWLKDASCPISDVCEGDEVVVYSGGDLAMARVVKTHTNGVKPVFRLRTKHREIRATGNHPLLRDTDGRRDWVKVSDLKLGDHLVIATSSPANAEIPVLAAHVPAVSEGAFVILTATGTAQLDSARQVWAQRGRRWSLLQELGLPPVWGHIRRGVYGVRLSTMRSLFAALSLYLSDDCWTPSGGRGGTGVSDLTLPERITPDFCRLYGYMLADGWISDNETTKQVGVSCGNKPEHAEFYLSLLKTFSPRAALHEHDGNFLLLTTSTALVGLLKKLGWKNGAHEKRLPDWIWGLPEEYREAMLLGFADGDGHTTQTATDRHQRVSIELCNYELTRDLKDLVDGLGYPCGRVRFRERTGISSINKDGRPILSGQSWTITYYLNRMDRPTTIERVISIEEDGEEEVFDLTIDHPDHNFIADGVVVHNSFEEVLCTENGVVGLNHLGTPTMRRVEKLNGSLIGFVQDVTGRFTANQDELRRMLAGALTIPKHVALFEDWQVCHFRLRAATRRSPYGMCIPADGQVWTSNGPVSIAKVTAGDHVLVRHCGLLRSSRVVETFTNGVKPVFKLKTTHRTLRATANHPLLRWRGGKNNTWEQLGDLRPGDEIVVATAQPAIGTPPPLGLCADYYDDATQVRLTERCVKAIEAATPPRTSGGPRDVGLAPALRRLSYSKKQVEDIRTGSSSIRLSDLKTLLTGLGLSTFTGAFEVYKDPSETHVTLPDFVTTEFCRLLGFLLGDGWITENQIYFARGTDEDQNHFYETLLGSFGPRVSFIKDKASCFVSSTRLVQAIRSVGWIDGAHEKRVPGWVFTLPTNYRLAFLTGFVDADGWTSKQTGPTRTHVELCNRDLVQDLKTLVDGLGWTCGNVRERPAREGKIRAGLMTYHGSRLIAADQIIRGGPSYTITWHETPLGADDFAVERIESIEPDGEEEVFDIGVADSDHNFICNGVVVHNSVGEGARWIWKRLVMLEDAVMIYKLTRAPARYAFYVDVTDVPPNRVESFLKRAKRDLKKKKMVNPNNNFLDMRYNPLSNDEDFFIAVRDGKALSRVEVLSGPDYQNVDDVQMFQRKLHGALMVPRAYMGQDAPIQGRAILCLTGDTKVPLLDGRTRSMKELAEEYGPGKEFYVYTIGAGGKITTGKAHSPQITRPNAEVWEVALDNGRTVRGTPDHPFMMRDGSYRRLDELAPGDSLMPLYRRDSTKSRDRLDGYDMHLCPVTGKWKFTHRAVAEAKWTGRSLKQEGRVVHHADFNKRNNDPHNLSDPLTEEHLQIHREHADKTILRPEIRAKAIENSRWWSQSKACAQLCRENLKKARLPGGGQRAWCASEPHRRLKSDQMKRQWAEPDNKLHERAQSETFKSYYSEKMKESIALGKIKVQGEDNFRWRHDADFARLVDVAKSYHCTSFGDLTKWTGYSSCLIYRLLAAQGITFQEFAETHLLYGFDPGGHKKLRAVRVLRRHKSDLSAAGVPENHKVISVKKLDTREDCYDFVVDGTHNYALDAGVFVHNSNEDVRAARVSLQIQKELRNGIERLIRTDLAARGHPSPWSVELDVMMTVPSNIYELAAMEVKNARADFATRIQPYVSMRWLLENVFKLSDLEIREIEKQRQREADIADSMGMDPSFSPFTGGRPPDQDAMPPAGGAGAGPGLEEVPGSAQPGLEEVPGQGLEEVPGAGLEEVPGNGLEEVRPKKNASQQEWRAYDRRRRLEERRYNESRHNHQKLVDMIGSLQENDAGFSRRLSETTSFLKEFKDAALKNSNGRLTSVPSAGGTRPKAGSF